MQCHKDELSIVYWNANGIESKIHELYDFLLKNFIDIACINETFLKSHSTLNSHPEFKIYRHDRDDSRRKGGVLIIVRKSIPHHLLPSSNCEIIENIGIEVNTVNRKIHFVSCYLPGGSSTTSIRTHLKHDIRSLTKSLGRDRSAKFYALGDLNCKHRYWGCQRANAAGTILYDVFNESNFDILFPNEYTYFPSDVNRQPSTLDIGLTNCTLTRTDLENHCLGSDHNAVSFKILLNENLQLRQPTCRPSYKDTNWLLYRQSINELLAAVDMNLETVQSTNEIDEKLGTLTSAIHEAQHRAVPLVNASHYGLVLTPEIEQLMRQRSTLERRCQRTRVSNYRHHLRSQINNLSKLIRNSVQALRNENWSNFLKSITEDDNFKKLWQTTKFLKNKNKKLPPLKTSSGTLVTPLEKAELMASHFASVHLNPLADVNPSYDRQLEASVSQFLSTPLSPENISYPSVNEIAYNIQSLRNSKAPGSDRIHNTLLKNLPRSGIRFCHHIIAACYKLTYFPIKWKQAKVIPILKPGKKSSEASSYRPISLLCSLSKILERTMLSRINMHIEDKNLIPPDQCGFVSGKSTTHQLIRIKNHIKSNLVTRPSHSTGMLLIDVEKAFDRVYHTGLLYKLKQFEFPLYLIKLIEQFTKNRSFIVCMENVNSTTHQIPFGLPQGAVCSPTLYNLYTADVPDPAPCHRALFADDTCFFVSSPFKKDITSGLRTTMVTNLNFFNQWKINLNLEKSQAMFFTRRRLREIPQRPLRINNSSTPWSYQSVKYLGVILDKTLTFRHHIEYVIEKMNKIIHIMYPLLNRSSKLNVKNKMLLYKLAIRPVLTYASPVFSDIAECHTKKLQIAQNKVLRMILDLPMYTSINTLHELANVSLIKDHMNKLTNNYNASNI